MPHFRVTGRELPPQRSQVCQREDQAKHKQMQKVGETIPTSEPSSRTLSQGPYINRLQVGLLSASESSFFATEETYPLQLRKYCPRAKRHHVYNVQHLLTIEE